MSRLWRTDLAVGLCPERLVLRDEVRPVGGDALAELRRIAGKAQVKVVLSSHFVRYTVLPWSAALASEDEWRALAQHSFVSTYGTAATAWEVRVSRSSKGSTRVATAIDGELLQVLRDIPGIVSIQPYLMAAFNARRAHLRGPAWFVLQEPGRLTLSRLDSAGWQAIRCRQAHGEWRAALADLLDREAAAGADAGCDHALVWSEEELPAALGRYRITDVTLSSRAAPQARSCAMALH